MFDNELLIELLKLNNIGLATICSNKNTIEFSDNILKILHIPNDKTIKLDNFLNSIISKSDMPLVNTFFSTIKQIKKMKNFEIMINVKSKKIWIRCSAILKNTYNEEIIYLFIEEITNKKTQELIIAKHMSFLQNILDVFPNPVFFKDSSFLKYRLINKSFVEFFELEKYEILEKTAFDLFGNKLGKFFNEKDKELIKTKNIQIYEHTMTFKNNIKRDLLINKSLVYDENKNIDGIIGTVYDITERNIAINNTKRFINLLESMIEISFSILNITDLKKLMELLLEKSLSAIKKTNIGSVLLLDENNRLKHFTSKGYNLDEISKLNLDYKKTFYYLETKGKIKKPIIIDNLDRFKSNRILLPSNKKPIKSSLTTSIYVDSNFYGIISIDSTAKNVFDKYDIELMEFISIQIENALKMFNLHKKTVYLSQYDKLTKIYNRSYFDTLYNKFFIKMTTNNLKFCASIIDINNLKKVNDTYGHLAGDKLIKIFANKLKKIINDDDIFARLGGDEFIWLSSSLRKEEMEVAMENLLVYFTTNYISYEDSRFKCTFSYGISEYPIDSHDKSEILKIADNKMYAFKENFKNLYSL